MRKKVIIFDLDGTLLDTLEDLTDSVNHVLCIHGYPARTIEEIRCFVGNGVKRLIRLALPIAADEKEAEICLKEFGAYYALHMQIKTKPYRGIKELLQLLSAKGYRLAIVSNKFDGAVKALNSAYFQDLIPVAIGESAGILKKPAADSVYQALKELGASLEHAVYIGDSEVDIKTAKNARIPCISVAWGFRTMQELRACGASVIVNDTQELLLYLTGCFGQE